MINNKVVSFSGHFANNAQNKDVEITTIQSNLYAAIVEVISRGFSRFIVDTSDEFNRFAAEIILDIGKNNSYVKLIVISTSAEGTPNAQKSLFFEKASEILKLPESIGKSKSATIEYLLDNTDMLICYYDGRYSVTEHAFEYAKIKNITTINIAPNDLGNAHVFDNIVNTVRDDLDKILKKDSKVSIVAACFSIYAYEELKHRLKLIKELRFIFTSPTFTTEKATKSKREFYIPRLKRERSLYGTEFEVKLRNELNQKAIAKECAEWIKQKVKFKSNNTSQIMQGFMNVNSDNSTYTYSPLNGFTTVDIGCERGNNAFNIIQRTAHPLSHGFVQVFDNIWNNKEQLQDVTDEVIENITSVYKENPAEYVYFLTLFNIFNEFLEDISEDVLPNEALGFKDTLVWNKLYNFQKDAAIEIITKLEKYNGCILADSVGLGKTFTALAVIKYYEKRNKDVLVLCPKKLGNNWNTFKGKYVNNPLRKDRFDYTVLYHTDLGRDTGMSNGVDLDRVDWANYGLIVIDESHNFRNGGQLNGEDNEKENRYLRLLNRVIRAGIQTKVLMLSATPVNNRFNDLKNQLALAYEGDVENIDNKLNTSASITEIFKSAQQAFNEWSKLPINQRTSSVLQKMLGFDFFEVLDSVTIARSRKQIEKKYDTSDIGKFPKRNAPISKRPPLTSLDKAITYNEIFEALLRLNLSVYTPTKYILHSKLTKYAEILSDKDLSLTSGRELGILRLTAINLMKRMESSVFSFNLTLGRIKALIESTISTINEFEKGLSNKTLSIADINDLAMDDYDSDDQNTDFFSIRKNININLKDVDFKSWRRDMEHDIEALELLQLMVSDIKPEYDSKLQELIALIKNKIERPINTDNKKIIIFTAFADTAEYLYKHVSEFITKSFDINTAIVTGSIDGKTTIPKFKCDLNKVLTCFSPLSKEKELIMPGNNDEIDILIATDCISEGQNLQDCDYLINYDIHWNPVRIIQRFGRIDRIGSKNECIQLVNFWPNLTLDEYINLKSRVETRMEIVNTAATGDDNILNNEEKLDLEYRRKQLERLQSEVVDLEDIAGGISIMDLGLNEFRMDLLSYMKNNPDIEKAPSGLHTVVNGDRDGIIFVLKNINSHVNISKQNRLHPFYMVYIGSDGEVLSNHLEPKNTLDIMRILCHGKSEPNINLCRLFNEQTNDGKNMKEISALLQQTLASIVQVTEESDVDSFFSGSEVSFLNKGIKGLDDFELITFVVVRSDSDA